MHLALVTLAVVVRVQVGVEVLHLLALVLASFASIVDMVSSMEAATKMRVVSSCTL